ncbi:MAG TPA: hypothetical protein VIL45_07045 [Thermoplasmata archaeon]
MSSIIRLDAGHDRNGNPRRCYLLLSGEGEILAVANEGYRGSGAIPDSWNLPSGHRRTIGVTLATTPAEYRELVKLPRDPK